MIQELDVVALTQDMAGHGLKAGDVGTVVHLYPGGACEVEFITFGGETVAIVTAEPTQVRVVGPDELHQTRPVERHP
jgi:hypothetical protein